jgi:hypothetical protein
MADINDLIMKKLENFPKDISALAQTAIRLSQTGLSEHAIAEQMGYAAKKIIKDKEV